MMIFKSKRCSYRKQAEGMLGSKKESPKGKGCQCAAYSEHECGCSADWADNDGYNQMHAKAVEVLAKVLEEKDKMLQDIKSKLNEITE